MIKTNNLNFSIAKIYWEKSIILVTYLIFKPETNTLSPSEKSKGELLIQHTCTFIFTGVKSTWGYFVSSSR